MNGLTIRAGRLARRGTPALLLSSLMLAAGGWTTAPPRQCPALTVSGPDRAQAGDVLTYNASPDAGRPFEWTTSAGTITGGQGSAQIEVIDVHTSSVTVTTRNQGCNNAASKTTEISSAVALVPRPVDTYGNIARNDEKARLDNLAISLQENPGAQAYLICYGGRRGRAGEAQRRCDRAKEYLVNTRGVDEGRIEAIDGGFKEDLSVELWIVPPGAQPPTPNPTVEPPEPQAAP
ncbi:MAG TPA: hypothetical protein VIP46_15120, partial [Pyrinomonadaceae bacterium]